MTGGEYWRLAGQRDADIVHREMVHCNTEMMGIDPLNIELFRAFRKAFHLHRRLLDKALADKGSYPAEAICLRIVGSHDGISQKDLADTLHLSRPRVTGLLQELERLGLVARRPDESDQRVTRVFLTEAGAQRTRELHRVFADLLECTLGAMPETERADLVRLLDRLTDCTKQALDSRAG
ncbi:MAG: MarR family transcriptional regulator [Actinobacteria bacterium]|nr:MarR family transcriptional regulator [Actinomycetota bacterium]